MTSFLSGADRNQGTMFPERLEDYVAEDNPVRVIDFFVDQLDLGQLGFGRVSGEADGKARLPFSGDVEALHLRLPQPRSVQPPA